MGFNRPSLIQAQAIPYILSQWEFFLRFIVDRAITWLRRRRMEAARRCASLWVPWRT